MKIDQDRGPAGVEYWPELKKYLSNKIVRLPRFRVVSIGRRTLVKPRCWLTHMALGPGVPDPPSEVVSSAKSLTRHRIGERLEVRARPVLGGLHHEYLPAPASA